MDATQTRITRDAAREKGTAVLLELGERLKERGLIWKAEPTTVKEEGSSDLHFVYFHYKDMSIGVLRIQLLPDFSDAKTLTSIGELLDSAALEASRNRFGKLSTLYENVAYMHIKMVYYQSTTGYSADDIEEKLAHYSHKLVSRSGDDAHQEMFGDA